MSYIDLARHMLRDNKNLKDKVRFRHYSKDIITDDTKLNPDKGLNRRVPKEHKFSIRAVRYNLRLLIIITLFLLITALIVWVVNGKV
ncbi:hypothetical protein EP331_06185 [bacterium]|nr:MAG: hypothetical protein EP331_06185 [bacterium]